MQTTKIGNKTEDRACKFLRSQGLQILFQNFRALPYGEIDIIAIDNCNNTQTQRDLASESEMTKNISHTRAGGYLYDSTHKPKDPRVKHEDDGIFPKTYISAVTGDSKKVPVITEQNRMPTEKTIQGQNETLVFVEVKYRKRTTFAKAEEMLTYRKQQKLINAANIFLQQNPEYENHECRFDLIAINEDKVNWIKDAFQLS